MSQIGALLCRHLDGSTLLDVVAACEVECIETYLRTGHASSELCELADSLLAACSERDDWATLNKELAHTVFSSGLEASWRPPQGWWTPGLIARPREGLVEKFYELRQQARLSIKPQPKRNSQGEA